jgi:hypothetical protein
MGYIGLGLRDNCCLRRRYSLASVQMSNMTTRWVIGNTIILHDAQCKGEQLNHNHIFSGWGPSRMTHLDACKAPKSCSVASCNQPTRNEKDLCTNVARCRDTKREKAMGQNICGFMVSGSRVWVGPGALAVPESLQRLSQDQYLCAEGTRLLPTGRPWFHK